MPVAVACSCGAKLRVPDTAAGKRVKCPKCGDAVAVPAAEAEFEMVEDDPPPTPAKRKPQLVEDDDAPRPARRSKPAPMEVDEAADDEEEEDERPKKKGKGKGKGNKVKGKNREQEKKKRLITLIVGICGATFVLGAVGAVVAIVMNSQDPAKAGISTQPNTPQPPAGWKAFKAGGMSVWIPESVTLNEKVPGPEEKPTPPIVSSKSWTNMDFKNPPKQEVTVYEIGRGDLDPQFVTRYQQDPAAAWVELTKQLKTDAAPGIQVTFTDGTLGGERGKQFVIQLPNNTRVTARTVIKGDKMYSATVLHKEAGENDPLVKTFFDSFKFE